jgi:hypothetical protein
MKEEGALGVGGRQRKEAATARGSAEELAEAEFGEEAEQGTSAAEGAEDGSGGSPTDGCTRWRAEKGGARGRGRERAGRGAGSVSCGAERERGGRTRLLFGKELEGAAVETPEEGLVELGFGPARPGLGCQLG